MIAACLLVCAVAFPIEVSADGRHMVDQNGAPFLINGDSPWTLAQALTKPETIEYLDDRQARGFNAIMTFMIDHVYENPNAEGNEPFTGAWWTTMNEAYFAHIDWLLAEAESRDIVILLVPAFLGYGCGTDGYCDELGTEQEMRDYGRWVGSRYATYPNIIWVMGGDTEVTPSAEPRHDAIAEGILEMDPNHLMTAHASRLNSGLDSYDKSWLSLNSTYSWCDSAPAKSEIDHGRIARAPFIFFEGQYETAGGASYCFRAQAYWSVLAGSTGHLYGNWDMWRADWRSSMAAQSGATLVHYGALFESRAWQDLRPDFAHTVLTAGYGSGAGYVGAALTVDGNTFIAYLPSQSPVTVDLGQITGTDATAWWYNPVNGTATLIGTNSGTVQYTPPASGDWVLVIDNAALGLPAPGTAPVPKPPTNLIRSG